MYKISIIIPIFNVEQYLERALKSILNQTMNLTDLEVIMVDDKSSDNSRSIIEEYENQYDNFKAVYLKTNSGGAGVPRNEGLKIASGKYVMFLDPDDEFALDMCETLYNRIEDSNAEVVKCNHKLVYRDSTKIEYQFDKNIDEVKINCKSDLPPNKVSVCNAIHNREFIEKNNLKFLNLKSSEDMMFSFNEFFNANKIIILNNYAGYKYYTNPTVSHSRTPTEENLDVILESYFIARDLIKKNNRTDIYYDFFSTLCFGLFSRMLDYNGDKKKYFKRFYEFEKSLKCTLKFRYKWMNIINKILMKNRISSAVFLFNVFNLIRKTPIIKFYRKLLYK